MPHTRRQLLAAFGTAAALGVTRRTLRADGPAGSERSVGTNSYPWSKFAGRDGREFDAFAGDAPAGVAAAGLELYEPIVRRPEDLRGFGEVLAAHGLSMPSIYVNSVLHDPSRADASTAEVVTIAEAAVPLGTRVVVTNPSPIRWGGDEEKSDAQLRFQAETLDALGAKLRGLGVTLAYHNHDAELRRGAREFHHMLTATEPTNVKYCLDAHWVFRGCGDSEVAVFDVLERYHRRVVELHLRQSVGGVWTEAFRPTGDIDYRRLIEFLHDRGMDPLLVLEQSVEAGTPHTLPVVEAHRVGRRNLAAVLN